MTGRPVDLGRSSSLLRSGMSMRPLDYDEIRGGIGAGSGVRNALSSAEQEDKDDGNNQCGCHNQKHDTTVACRTNDLASGQRSNDLPSARHRHSPANSRRSDRRRIDDGGERNTSRPGNTHKEADQCRCCSGERDERYAWP